MSLNSHFTLFHILGILSQRWKVVTGPIIGKVENIETLIAACCVLHNYLLINNDNTYLPPGSVDTISGRGEGHPGYWRADEDRWQPAPPTNARNPTIAAAQSRAEFTNYFVNEGALPWQFDYINRRVTRM